MSNYKNNHPKTTTARLIVLICLLIGLIFLWQPAIAQTNPRSDSLQYTKETKQDTVVKYMDLWEYAFMMHEETSWLFKIDFPANKYGLNQIKIGIEKKIASAFSLNLNLGFTQSNIFSMDSIYLSNYQFGFNASLETRWYYRMNKRIRVEKVAGNMSDNYLAIGLTYSHSYYTPTQFSFNIMDVYLKWGVQRRFLKYGYVNFGVKAGAYFIIEREWTPAFSFNNFMDVGFAFTKDKYALDRDILCPILKCYDADKYIFKSNLNGVFGIMFTKYSAGFSVAPNIAFEHKIGKSSFSINTEFRPVFSYFFLFDNQNYNKYWDTEMSLSLEGRWYYNLKRRMLRGKTGNGLSANYMALGGSMTYSDRYDFYGDKFHQYLYITTGWQRLFSKHLYFDMNIGIGYKFKTKNEKAGASWPFNVAVGYRF
ncbi:MAG: hypothetical protein DRJ02_09555 [Bacteroidetes bacterium]|nr:MAG: hypothetical protein DRJ02_09555 [Bacteroidota bacterium]